MSTRTGIALGVVAGLGTLGVAGQAAADAPDYITNDPYITPSGVYAGIGWGHFDLKLDNLDDVGYAVNSITHSGDDAWKLNLGYRFTPFFSLEGDYVNFGNPGHSFIGVGSDGNYKLHVSGFAPLGVATLPLGPFEVFGKAGWLFYNSNLQVNLNQPGSEVLESTHTRSDFIWGGGIGVTFLRHLNVNAEYDVVKITNAPDSNALWLSAVWRF